MPSKTAGNLRWRSADGTNLSPYFVVGMFRQEFTSQCQWALELAIFKVASKAFVVSFLILNSQDHRFRIKMGMPGIPTMTLKSIDPSTRCNANLARFIMLGSIGTIGLWIAGCAGSGGGSSNALYSQSITRLKAVDLGVIEYIDDYDDALPTGRWMDAVLPYTKDETLFHSPAVGSKGYGYALNSAVQGQTLPQFPNPSIVVTLFDSTDLSRNATDPLSTEPSPPRYGTRNTIAYLDGHVQDQDILSSAPTLYEQSQTHLKSVGLGMLMYSNDYDGAFPLANQWYREMMPYVKSDIAFHSPIVQLKSPADYGYAFNIGVAGQLQSNITSPATTISFFDSTVLTRNATEPTTTLPNPPRYGKNNTIAYVDGHVHP